MLWVSFILMVLNKKVFKLTGHFKLYFGRLTKWVIIGSLNRLVILNQARTSSRELLPWLEDGLASSLGTFTFTERKDFPLFALHFHLNLTFKHNNLNLTTTFSKTLLFYILI